MERLIEESASVWNNDSQVSVSDHSTGTKGTAAAVQSGERDFTHIKTAATQIEQPEQGASAASFKDIWISYKLEVVRRV